MFDIECRFWIFFSRKLEIGIPITFTAFRILLEQPSPSQKIQAFFGPGVTAGITETGEGKVEVELVSDGSDASGPSGNDDMEVLPPLMPGLPPRYVKKGKA